MTAALVAADCGKSVLLLEKGALYGGSTAMSGGAIWVPNNHLMRKAGIADSTEEAITYLKSITAGKVSEERLQAYVEVIPKMLRYLEKCSRVRFQLMPGYADYYPNNPGSKANGGRSLEPVPFNRRKLRNTPGQMQAMTFMPHISVTAREARLMLNSSLWARVKAARFFLAYALNPTRLLAKGDPRLTAGNALIGRLRCSLADRDVPVWLHTAARKLTVEKGRVTSLEADRDGNRIAIGVNRAVILAAGGFEHNKVMREKYQRQPIADAWTVGCSENTGDAITMGLEVGAAVDLMDDAWWCSTSLIPRKMIPYPIVFERSLPGSILVNGKGKRFTNEAGPYIDVVRDQYADHKKTGAAIPAYLIVDSRYRKKYPLGAVMPRTKATKYIERGYLKVSDTIEGLASQCRIEASGLVDEVSKFNQYAMSGKDADFNRGDTTIDRYYGDPSVKPNPCLAPLDKPPYYAIELWPGDLGTKGGLKTDAFARVLRADGSPISGLYATGNCSASVMGNSYAGAGATIGPSMVFGYIAALHACGRYSGPASG
jgi:3-oxosteroid 1-dehydrogenase